MNDLKFSYLNNLLLLFFCFLFLVDCEWDIVVETSEDADPTGKFYILSSQYCLLLVN